VYRQGVCEVSIKMITMVMICYPAFLAIHQFVATITGVVRAIEIIASFVVQ